MESEGMVDFVFVDVVYVSESEDSVCRVVEV